MEAVIFIGIQSSGKSTFYRERFFNTHVRINLDMLRTRHRESVLLQACLSSKQSFVVDNTNVTSELRRKYIEPAKAAGFQITGYYFQSKIVEGIQRNRQRKGNESIPKKGLLGTYKRLQLPSPEEGFDQLFYVSITDSKEFVVKEWSNEV